MKPKTKKIINIIAAIVPAGLVILSGIFKFMPPPEMLEGFRQMNIEQYMPLFGMMEFSFAILFVIPQTRRAGFVLLSCYFAGAMATDLSHGRSVANAMLPMSLVWVGMFIRDRHAFLPDTRTAVEA